jgi:hypothetical protein
MSNYYENDFFYIQQPLNPFVRVQFRLPPVFKENELFPIFDEYSLSKDKQTNLAIEIENTSDDNEKIV